jgi:hypothetical protein
VGNVAIGAMSTAPLSSTSCRDKRIPRPRRSGGASSHSRRPRRVRPRVTDRRCTASARSSATARPRRAGVEEGLDLLRTEDLDLLLGWLGRPRVLEAILVGVVVLVEPVDEGSRAPRPAVDTVARQSEEGRSRGASGSDPFSRRKRVAARLGTPGGIRTPDQLLRRHW